MKYLLTLLLFLTFNAKAEEYYYLEVREELACLEFPTLADASNAVPEVVSDIEATNYTAQVHVCDHSITDGTGTQGGCKIVPVADGDKQDYVKVEIVKTEAEKFKQTQFLAMPYDGTQADADKKAEKLKNTKWLKNRETVVIKEKRDKK